LASKKVKDMTSKEYAELLDLKEYRLDLLWKAALSQAMQSPSPLSEEVLKVQQRITELENL
jgi:hypothetical protein